MFQIKEFYFLMRFAYHVMYQILDRRAVFEEIVQVWFQLCIKQVPYLVDRKQN
jgi:hypothetical protein